MIENVARSHVDSNKLYILHKAGRVVNWHWQPTFARPQVLYSVQDDCEEAELKRELSEIFKSDVEMIFWPRDAPIPEPFALYTGQKRS